MTEQIQQEVDPNAAITTWQEQVAPLAGFAQAASDILGAIEGPLGELYTQAEQNSDTATIERVMAVWNQSQQLANLIPPFAAALQGGGSHYSRAERAARPNRSGIEGFGRRHSGCQRRSSAGGRPDPGHRGGSL